MIPRLRPGVRLSYDDVRSEHVLLVPEGVVRLNATAAETLELCDGERSVGDIVSVLDERYRSAELDQDVRALLDAMAQKGLVTYADA